MGITVEQHPCWLITCDICGDGDNSEYDGHYHHATEADARAAIRDIDWRELPDGRLVCMPCWEDHIPGKVACPWCKVPVGTCCVRPSFDPVVHDERLAAWAAAHPAEARS